MREPTLRFDGDGDRGAVEAASCWQGERIDVRPLRRVAVEATLLVSWERPEFHR